MAEHRHARTVLRHLRELGLAASIDEDGDVVTEVDGATVVVSLNDLFLHARMFYNTAAPVNALAMVSRRLNQRIISGRIVFPDEGRVFVVDFAHAYNGAPSDFDSRHTVRGVLDVAKSVVDIANEYGYAL